ncbi:MAG: penicillin-binding protein 2 [Nitrospirales bacterium]|nr:penicillin-binding protein 2 [Nitrospirales bacterium]NKB82779.1 penicillin-binding protein 2 [Nitrospirales bacterium]
MATNGFQSNELGDLQQRLIFLKIGIFILIGLLVLRLWQLQIKEGPYYRELSQDNRTRSIVLRPARGLIYDRNGILLANNIPSFNLYVELNDVVSRDGLITTLVDLLAFDATDLSQRLQSQDSRTRIKIKGGLSLREATLIESHRLDLPGVVIQPEYQRNNPQGNYAAHVLGYIGAVSEKQLAQDQFSNLTPGSLVGQQGIERMYDGLLQGMPGRKLIEVDALGHEKQTLSVDSPQAGDDLYLTIDFRLQQLAEELLGKEAGAIVALDPNNGAVLALASQPGFDPNALSRGLPRSQWHTILQDPYHPLTNRAIQGLYPPGSTFKIVMATGALETNTIAPLDTVQCQGGYRLGNHLFRDWKASGHGTVNLSKALTHSCDVYFYKIGHRMGIDTIATYAHHFGLGEKTGIDLPSEQDGIVPSSEWKKQIYGEPWYPGETISVSIGQGFLTVTPIQMANVIATIANGGTRYTPHIMHSIRHRKLETIEEQVSPEGHLLTLQPNWIARIQEALVTVVTKGTAQQAKSAFVSIAGKTGTAQVVALQAKAEKEQPKAFQDHAWFVAYAPANAPRVAVAVVVEHMGHGGSIAAPLAKLFIEAFMQFYPNAQTTPFSVPTISLNSSLVITIAHA